MSFQNNKTIHGTYLTQAVEIYPNACKYSTTQALSDAIISIPAITDVQTGNITVSGGDPVFFQTSDPYLKIEEEFLKITVVDATTITIDSRGEFGTTPAAHGAGSATIMHSGQSDGSCRGYPQLPDGSGCSTADSFDKDVTRPFLFLANQATIGQVYYNGLQSIDHNPVELKPGESMAKNASVSVTITDNTDDDVYAVPYPELRSSNSTLFKKLLARHPYMQNRMMKTYSMVSTSPEFKKEDSLEREYIIDSINLTKSSVTIRGLDPLMLAEESKAKAPQASAGRLAVALADTGETQIQLKDFAVNEYGVNSATGTVAIDNELFDYTVADAALGILTIDTRGVGGSEVKSHSINATVQFVIVWENFNPVERIIWLLQTYTNIPAGYFGDYTDAQNAVQPNSGKIYIPKPTSVKKLIDELIRAWSENGIALYFDELQKKIRIKALGDFQQQPITLSDEVDVKEDSIRVSPNYKDQITRASIGFAPFDAAKKPDDENSSILFTAINIVTELSGTLEPKEDKEFFTRFLTASDTDVSIAVGGAARIANINERPPLTYNFDIDYENFGTVPGGVIEEGEIINLTTSENVDSDGNPKSENLQILSLKDNPQQATYTVKAKLFQDIVNEADFDFIIDEDKENYVLSDEFAPLAPGEYTVFITSGTTIGATSTSNYAFNTGVQAAGVTLKLVVRGSILGAGGRGADGVTATAPSPNDSPSRVVTPGRDGPNGGDAINLTVDTTIDTSQGVIYAGGGGAPSDESIADSSATPVFVKAGNAGSGGQGYVGGTGGIGGYASIEPFTVEDTGINGQDGTRSSPGSVGSVSAGAWGKDSEVSFASGNAGLGGFAIRSNGNTINIIGDNAATIKGKRDF